MNELKPCAHCGGPAAIGVIAYDTLKQQIASARVECRSCCIQTAIYSSPEKAADKWNTRAETNAEDSELVKKLKAMIYKDASGMFPTGFTTAREQAIKIVREWEKSK